MDGVPAAAPATLPKPHKSGRGWDDALARYVVRRRASYGTTRAAAETHSPPARKRTQIPSLPDVCLLYNPKSEEEVEGKEEEEEEKEEKE